MRKTHASIILSALVALGCLCVAPVGLVISAQASTVQVDATNLDGVTFSEGNTLCTVTKTVDGTALFDAILENMQGVPTARVVFENGSGLSGNANSIFALPPQNPFVSIEFPLNASDFDTSGLTEMSSTFGDCSRVSSLNLRALNTERVTTMQGLFSGCSALSVLDISSFNTQNVTHATAMFDECTPSVFVVSSDFANASIDMPYPSAPAGKTYHAYYQGKLQEGVSAPSTSYLKSHPGVSVFVTSSEDEVPVVFDANGGSWEGGVTQKSASGSFANGVATPTAGLSKSGYELAGWATSPDAQEAQYDASRVELTQTTFYAVWRVAPAPEPAPEPQKPTDGWHWDNTTGWRYAQNGAYLDDGWHWIDDGYGSNWYYFEYNGTLKTSAWIWDGVWYYCLPSGAMARGTWNWIDGDWYGFWWDGKMCTGWIWDAGYVDWFYCYSSGVMARNTWVGDYYFNDAGAWVR